jgi:hypothetical protein
MRSSRTLAEFLWRLAVGLLVLYVCLRLLLPVAGVHVVDLV